MSDLLDHAINEKYSIMKINEPLIFVKNAIDWDAFTPLLNDLYHNDTDNGGRPNIPVKTMVKVLFLQSMFNMVDEQVETLIKDRISFMNFLDYPDQYPDVRTIWLFRERLSKTAKDHNTTIDLSKRGIIVYRDRGYFGHDPKAIDGTMD